MGANGSCQKSSPSQHPAGKSFTPAEAKNIRPQQELTQPPAASDGKEGEMFGSVVSKSLPLVADLLRENVAHIAAIRANPTLEGLLGAQHDDLFILRYLLSNGQDVERASASIHKAVLWRHENAELLARVGTLSEEVRSTIATGILPWRTASGRPIQFTMPFAVPYDQWATKSDRWHFEAGIANREGAFEMCDELTRKSGRLVKLTLLQDSTGLTMGMVMRSSKLAKNQGKLSKLSEFLYPQLIYAV
ncbi:hypothetical protein T492DRAFT_866316, partial [Pavlovales sp. CCMP2436]